MNNFQVEKYTQLISVCQSKGGKLLTEHFVDNATSVWVECKRNHQWRVIPKDLFKGTWCRKCHFIDRKKTIDDVRSALEQRGSTLLSKEYQNCSSPLSIQCPSGHTYQSKWKMIQQGYGCPYCAGNAKKSVEEIQQFVAAKGGKLITETYVDCKTKMEWECKEGHRWITDWHSIQCNHWCHYCATAWMPKKIEDLKKEAEDRGGKLISDEYLSGHHKMEWQCDRGHIWFATWQSVQSGRWCNICYISHGEREIRAIFKEWELSYVTEFRIDVLSTRRFDFMFEYNNHKWLLEYDGKQHFEGGGWFDETTSLEERQEIDIVKTYIAHKCGYRLIRIDYTQIKSIEDHLKIALASNKDLYLSTPSMYAYLKEPTDDQLTRYGLAIFVKPKPRLVILDEPKPKLTMRIVESV